VGRSLAQAAKSGLLESFLVWQSQRWFAAVLRPFDMRSVPIWLPPLPFAVVAISAALFWHLGLVSGTRPLGQKALSKPASSYEKLPLRPWEQINYFPLDGPLWGFGGA